MNNEKKYKVLPVEGKKGLTVGSKVLTPGTVFFESQWPYGIEALEAAVVNDRCKEIIEKKKPEKKKPERKKKDDE